MKPDAINFREKFIKLTEYYQPKIVAALNDYHFKLAKIKGEFVWHSHSETDEAFIIIGGKLEIEFRDGTITLKEGEMCVIPKDYQSKGLKKVVKPMSLSVTNPTVKFPLNQFKYFRAKYLYPNQMVLSKK